MAPIALGATYGIPDVVVVVALVVVILLLTGWAGYRCYRFRGALARAPDALLDERQVVVRDRAYRDSYRIYAGVLATTLFALQLGQALFRWTGDLSLASPMWLLSPVVASIALPSAVVAWQEPDLAREA